jgi:hypothetical protein
MTPFDGFAHISLRSARWLLPWIAALFVSVTVAYALGSVIRGGSTASDHSEIQMTLSTGEAARPPDLKLSTTSLSDTAMEHSGGTFGIMSITSPASTGHASPAGCCTWD